VGFNHCYISTIENLQLELDSVGLEVFVKRYQRYYALTGPTESMNFLEEKQKEYGLQSLQMVDKGKTEQTT
jgi:hypothetical protein